MTWALQPQVLSLPGHHKLCNPTVELPAVHHCALLTTSLQTFFLSGTSLKWLSTIPERFGALSIQPESFFRS